MIGRASLGSSELRPVEARAKGPDSVDSRHEASVRVSGINNVGGRGQSRPRERVSDDIGSPRNMPDIR